MILKDGYTLTCLEGIHVPNTASLTIYAQAGGTGALVAEVSDGAAIGGDDWGGWGDITICGGTITAKSQAQAGIGGGYASNSCGNVSIYGGVIDTSGIHGGTVHYGGAEMGNILIQGATVTSSKQIGSGYSLAMNSAGVAPCGNITIVDSVVKCGSFLGTLNIKFYSAKCGDIVVSNSTVIASGSIGGVECSLVLENEQGKNLCVMGQSFVLTMPERKVGTIISGDTGTVYTDTQINAMVDLSNVNLTVNEGTALTLLGEESIKSLTVASGAQVTFENDLTIGQGQISGTTSGTSAFTNTGSLTINQDGSILCDTLSNSGNLTVNQDGSILCDTLSSSGNLTVNQGGEVACKDLSNSGTMTVQGTVTADTTFQNTSYITVLPQGALTTPGGENQGIIENTGTWSNSGSITGDGIVVSTTEIPGAEDQQMSATLPYLNEEGERTWIGQEDVLYPLSSLVKEWKQIDGKTTWYVVNQDTVIDGGVKVTDDINLLLMDGATLTVHGVNNNGGIRVDSGHTLNIYAQSQGETMGKLVATSGHYNWMAIGGMGCTINIYGGYIDTTDSSGGTGINPGMDNKVGVVNIASGIVHTKSIGSGDTVTGGQVSLVSSGLQNAVVYTNQSRMTEATKNTFRGILFLKEQGQVLGDQKLTMDLTLQAGQTLTVPQGTTLTIPKGITLDVQGDLVVDGTVDVYGILNNQSDLVNNGQVRIHFDSSFTGTQPTVNGLSYQIDWDTDGDGTVDDTTYVAYGKTPDHEDGSKEPTVDTVYTFTGWSPETASVTGTATYKAQFSSSARTYTVTVPTGEGYTIQYTGGTEVAYNNNFTFTLNIKGGYSTTEEFAVKANGKPLSMNGEYNYTAIITGNTVITVEGVADTTAPSNLTVSYETNGFKEFLNTITFGLFFKNTVTVTISATDEGSGVKEISYQLGDDGELKTVETQNGSISFTVEPEFKGNIKNVTATDNAGNTSEGIDYEYFAVEKNKPADVTVNTNGYESGKWTNGDVTITVSGSTATSGIAKYQYSTDGGQSWHDMTATEKTDATATDPLNVTEAQLVVSHSGTADYIFRAVSNAGNESASSNPVAVKIDKVQPTIAATGDTDSYLTGDTITITADAGESGIASVEVRTDDGDWTDITDSYLSGYTVTANGTYTFRVTNGAGVTASTSITYDNLDSVKPVVSIDSDEYISGNWTNKNVTLSVSNTAANLGTTTVQYKVDDGNWQTYNGAITVSEETDGTVYTFKAISASGVESAEVSITVKLDKTAPDGDVEIAENSVKKFINTITFGLFFNKNVDVTITGTDELSGVASVEYYRSEEILTEDDVLTIEDWTVYSSISETAKDAEKFIYYVKVTDHAGNVTCFGSEGITFDLTAPVITGITDGATYYTTQSVTVTDENFASVTVNDVVQSDSSFTLAGNVEKTYTMIATDKAGNSTTVTVTMKPIASLTESIKNITIDNVTSEDKADIENVKNAAESVDLTTAAAEEKATIDKILDHCESLLAKLEESAQAGDTENVDKVENITSDNVKPEDKDNLTQAKEDLENALENFGDNYTEEEKEELEEKLEQINNALDSIEKVEAVEDAITALPDTVEPDDTKTETLINEVKDQYDALSEHEKTLLSEQLKEKLESLLGDLLDYRIIEGNGSKWTVGDDGSLTITANGPVEKFTGIEVDGKAVDAANYTVKSGSTIISLKPEYLNTLSVGKHTLTVIYTDGETSGEFEIVKNAETVTPETGDNSNTAFWITLMFIAACGLTGAMVYGRKKKYGK